jgi:DNA invertase Pin-like site-specific DNA recombinase
MNHIEGQTFLTDEQAAEISKIFQAIESVIPAAIFEEARQVVEAQEDSRDILMAKSKSLTPEQRTSAIDLYLSGLTLREVGKEIGVSHQTVSDILVAHNVELRPKGWRRFSDLQEQFIALVYEDVKSITIDDIAGALNVARETILGVLVRRDVKRRPTGGRQHSKEKNLPLEEIVKKYQEESTPVKDLAAEYKVDVATFYKYLRRGGATLRQPKSKKK